MDFELSEEQKNLQQIVTRLVKEKLQPLELETGEDDYDVCWPIVDILAKTGLLGAHIPIDYGGSAINDQISLNLCLIREKLAPCSPAELVFAVNGLGSYPIVLAGNEDQKKEYLSKAASGKHLFSFGLTEPNAGSDVANIETTALYNDGYYVLNGRKSFISNAGVSDYYVVFAKTDPNAGSKGISAFILEKGTPGFSIGQMYRLTAPHPIGELIFEDCKIPQANMLGCAGQGFKIALGTLDVFRQTVGAMAIGVAQAALDISAQYTKQRKAFGKEIAQYQAIQFKLADMAVNVSAGRLLVYYAAWLKDRGASNFTKASSIAKLFSTEIAQQVTYEAQQIFGGNGVVRENLVERLHRQIRATTIYEGTSEIQRLIIARQVLKEV